MMVVVPPIIEAAIGGVVADGTTATTSCCRLMRRWLLLWRSAAGDLLMILTYFGVAPTSHQQLFWCFWGPPFFLYNLSFTLLLRIAGWPFVGDTTVIVSIDLDFPNGRVRKKVSACSRSLFRSDLLAPISLH